MEDYLHNSYSSYFNALSKLGYLSDNKGQSLLILTFIYRLIYEDYRGIINKEDYASIEKAITCFYGSNCLLPYKDYLKMGRLHIGDINELATRVKALETIHNNNNSTNTAQRNTSSEESYFVSLR